MLKIIPVGAFPCLPYAFPLLICIWFKSMTSPIVITKKCLPPYIMKRIVISFLLEEHNKNNRLASACPSSNLSPVFGPSIESKIGIREAITQQREKRLPISYLALKLRHINKTHTESGVEKSLFQLSLRLLIQR